MKLLDYFFYKIYKFLLHRSDKLTAELMPADIRASVLTGLLLGCLAGSLLCTLGIFYDNPICLFMKKYNSHSFVILEGVVLSLLAIHYTKYVRIEDIKKSYEALSRGKRIFINLIFYSSLVLIPVWLFISYRLYILGEI